MRKAGVATIIRAAEMRNRKERNNRSNVVNYHYKKMTGLKRRHGRLATHPGSLTCRTSLGSSEPCTTLDSLGNNVVAQARAQDLPSKQKLSKKRPKIDEQLIISVRIK